MTGPAVILAGAVWDLSEAAPRAKANKANCQLLSNYAQDMLRIFELKGELFLCPRLQSQLLLAWPMQGICCAMAMCCIQISNNFADLKF